MTSKLKLLVTSSGVSLAMLCAAPAFAGGTASNTLITNTVNVNFQVGGVSQSQQTAFDEFRVDRKVLFTLEEKAPTGTTTVSPGQTARNTTFILTNNSNAVFDFVVTPSQLAGGTAAHGGTDAFDVTNLLVCRDNNTDNVCDSAATGTLTIDDLGVDQSTTILVVGDIPLTATNGQVAGISLSAEVRESVGTTLITPATDATVNAALTMETIFADTAKTGNGGTSIARDGIDVATDDYTVSAAVLSVFKSSVVVDDGVSSSNFKSVPGAEVEYCISVANAVGGAQATNINISDVVPATMAFKTGSLRVNGTVTNPGINQTCSGGTGVSDAVDTDAGSFDSVSKTVAGTLNNLSGGSSSALIFRAIIN
ncbi:hypothetical protein [Sphingorhabdus contaminans]|uniref:DUF11 domain-containing protein n=1 Tax=Sphingorhabdus contaminans TaxID=1343899 RepID=A0A553WIT1_9SPHN|nr:hypothetical protein [Sphingorhabdus contaminans]TSB04588.1 hypothetical protein FOM92_04010 [Sphingorhabdus contaminans]